MIWRFFNDQPGVSDAGGVEGMQRRIIKFNIQKMVLRPDRQLKAKLRNELPGILQWAWSLSLDQIEKAFDSAGRIASISSASIEAQLDASPWLKFLIETYQTGKFDIPARDLFREYQRWCADEGRTGVLNQTNFGRKLKKLIAPEGMESSAWPVAKRSTNAGNRYDISPMRDFDLARFFGLTGTSEELKPPQEDGLPQNPPPQDQPREAGSRLAVNSVDSLSSPTHARKNEGSLNSGENARRKNPAHPSLPGMSTAAIGSAHDVAMDGDDPYWGPRSA